MKETDRIRVCLVNPKLEGPYPPLGLAYVASYLRKYGKHDYDIKIVDGNCSNNTLEDILSFEPSVLGFTALSPQIKEAVALSNAFKRRAAHVPQVIGGVHISGEQENTLKRGSFDLAVLGEGEETFKEVVDFFIDKGNNRSEYRKINGIAYLEGSELATTPARGEIGNLDMIPPPARALLNMEHYLSHYLIIRGLSGNRITTIHTSRGCPFDCTFCSSTIVFKKVRHASIDYVINEIYELIDRYKVKSLFFTDDTFIVNKPRIRELCLRLIKEGFHKRIKWEVQGRANLISLQDLELLKLMKEAGCIQIDYGFETGSERILKFLKKTGVSIAHNKLAMEVTKASGLNVMGTFMLGVIGETENDIELTKNFILENSNKIDNFQVFIATPYPGAELYNICKEKKIIESDYFDQIAKEEDRDFLPFYSDTLSYEKVHKVVKMLNKLALRKIKISQRIRWVLFNFLKEPFKTIKKINSLHK